MPIQKATQSSGVQLCEYWWRADVNGCPLEVHALRCSIISTGCLHLLVCLCAHGMWFVLVVLVVVVRSGVTVALVMQRSSRHYTGEGCGRRNMSKEDCYLVDPASSHMLVSKIKPCMFKKLVVGPWVGSIGPPLVCTGRLVPSAGDALLALIGRVVPPVCDALRCSGPHARYTDVFNESIALADRPGVRIAATWAVRCRRRREKSTEPYHLEEGEVVTRRAACVALSPPLGARVLTIASGNPNKNPGAGCAKEMKLTCVASANRRRFLSGAVTKMKLKMTLGNGYLGSRIDEERSEMRYLVGDEVLGGIWPPVIRALRMAEKGACAGQSPRSTVDEQMPRDRPCVGCPYGWASGEASSAADRAQVPWKGAPERVRAPSCPDPVAPRGAVGESGCLGMQPQSGGKRMGAGGVSRSDVERRLAGLPIGSGCGPMQITAAAQAQAVDMPVETSSSRLWMAARAVWRASAPARSWRRPAGSPFGPS
ncbi:hypothetical protein G2W53_040046 [Senna tora]|uniref:Uncharacterized protein n=1 Tax=Senna tora TaxID=362788 RepID=A0A834SS29_9FABA|nr:hypothetical protein G2W53_040046 [Senna tora]